MNCLQCQRPFAQENRIAAISGSIMGDEHTDVYFLCPVCEVYTIACWHDNFTGTETLHLSGPETKPKGDARVALIGKCLRPWDKKCRCQAHRRYFNDTLD
jgi:hypothetical protein